MYYTLNDNLPNRDYRYGKAGQYEKECKSEFNPMFRKAKKNRNDKVGKKCTVCNTLKSLAGKCECD
jgi:hypothetical protein